MNLKHNWEKNNDSLLMLNKDNLAAGTQSRSSSSSFGVLGISIIRNEGSTNCPKEYYLVFDFEVLDKFI